MEFVTYVMDKVQIYSVLNSVPQHDAVYVSGFRVTCILVFDTRYMRVLSFIYRLGKSLLPTG